MSIFEAGGVVHLFRILKWKYQRMKRGWADEDVWDLGGYVCKILAGGLVQLADTTHGCPCLRMEEGTWTVDSCTYCDCAEKWDSELRENAERFRRIASDDFETYDEEKVVCQEVSAWLGKRLHDLWD